MRRDQEWREFKRQWRLIDIIVDIMGCAYKKHCIIMAIRSIVLVLFARFLVSASATYCLHSSDCISDLQTCCSDHVCRQTCYFCWYDYQCGSEECCSPDGNCWMKCSDDGCRKDCFYCSKDSECDAGRGECCWDSDCRKKCSDGVCTGSLQRTVSLLRDQFGVRSWRVL